MIGKRVTKVTMPTGTPLPDNAPVSITVGGRVWWCQESIDAMEENVKSHEDAAKNIYAALKKANEDIAAAKSLHREEVVRGDRLRHKLLVSKKDLQIALRLTKRLAERDG